MGVALSLTTMPPMAADFFSPHSIESYDITYIACYVHTDIVMV